MRYEELDSLRGIAALIVLFGHFLFIFPTIGNEIDSKYGLFFSILWSGHSAVIIFFVLSGFVLTMPFIGSQKQLYRKYITKRICRIYIPYLTVVTVAVVMKISLYSKIGTIPGLIQWGRWDIDVTFSRIIDHIIFLGHFNSDAFLMVIWSLVHEMRISLIFPLIALFVIKFGWKKSIGLALILSVVSFTLIHTFSTEFNTTVSTNYFITLHYSSMFVIGSLLAVNREYLIRNFNRVKAFYFLIPLSLFLLSFPGVTVRIVAKFFGKMNDTLAFIVTDWTILCGAVLIILLSLSSKAFSGLLLLKPIHFLGKISYSLYLVHPVILITMVHILFGTIPKQLILFISFIISLLVSWLCYKFIEKPAITLGKYLTKQKTSKSIQNKEASA
ncbi:acyltransferase [Neobacillus sp. PS3-12]|jgi:peptidoglycan/LPS O-acetylase OafA/YrhL|uniref:acyltransferase family protein n=1 Tax=Neobacillus sp. PS3-12 TaxID=3070677 RepID=UPI0027E1BE66|nr:acyltransferase [Neobacillus sp. PS3-12]WML51607.1 acyltransferase [Neobacillus sp. PS3-12]